MSADGGPGRGALCVCVLAVVRDEPCHASPRHAGSVVLGITQKNGFKHKRILKKRTNAASTSGFLLSELLSGKTEAILNEI